jgi:glycolate oxidase FAD binding subunit
VPADSAEETRYTIAGMVPARVFHPAREQDVADMLVAAREAGETVVAVGGRTMLDIGDRPSAYTFAVVTDRLTGIVEYNPGDLTIVVRAGTTLAEVESELGRHGQFLSLQAPFPERATIGGALAANASGPLRLAYGSARDAVIGTRVALPSGQIARSGGRVVKNVAGYDLSKLFIGSFGTLGIIVEAAFKVFPRQQARRMLVVAAPDIPVAMRGASVMSSLGPGLLSLAVVNTGLARTLGWEKPAIVVLMGGTEGATEELTAEAISRASSTSNQIWEERELDRVLEGLRDFPGRATVRISSRDGLPHGSVASSEEVEALAYPSIGTSFVHAPQWVPQDVAALRQDVARSGGHVVVWHGSPALDAVTTWGEVGPELALMRAVKRVFDPHGIMSPGRFVGDI